MWARLGHFTESLFCISSCQKFQIFFSFNFSCKQKHCRPNSQNILWFRKILWELTTSRRRLSVKSQSFDSVYQIPNVCGGWHSCGINRRDLAISHTNIAQQQSRIEPRQPGRKSFWPASKSRLGERAWFVYLFTLACGAVGGRIPSTKRFWCLCLFAFFVGRYWEHIYLNSSRARVDPLGNCRIKYGFLAQITEPS